MPTDRSETTKLAAARATQRLLDKGIVRIRALTSDLIEPHGLTAPQFLALSAIRAHEGITLVGLAAELDADANAVSALIDRLARKQLIERRRHATDGRAVCLSTTALGQHLVAETQPDVDRLSLHLASLVPPADKAAVERWLWAIATLRSVP